MSWVARRRKEQDVGIGKVCSGDTIFLLEKQIKEAVFWKKSYDFVAHLSCPQRAREVPKSVPENESPVFCSLGLGTRLGAPEFGPLFSSSGTRNVGHEITKEFSKIARALDLFVTETQKRRNLLKPST